MHKQTIDYMLIFFHCQRQITGMLCCWFEVGVSYRIASPDWIPELHGRFHNGKKSNTIRQRQMDAVLLVWAWALTLHLASCQVLFAIEGYGYRYYSYSYFGSVVWWWFDVSGAGHGDNKQRSDMTASLACANEVKIEIDGTGPFKKQPNCQLCGVWKVFNY